MRRFVALLLACSGCDGLFGLTRDGYPDAATGDAIDAPAIDADTSRPCVGRQPAPVFCFDFDGPTQVGYEDGVEFPLSLMIQGAIVDRRGPAATGTRALWMTSTNNSGIAAAARDAPTKSFHQVSARLWLRGTIPPTATREQELLRIAIDGATECYLALHLEPIAMDLIAQFGCGNAIGRLPFAKLTDAWHRYELAFDAQTGVGTASVDGNTAIPNPIQGVQGHMQPPVLIFGLFGSDDSISIGFDDLDVTGL